MRMPDDTGHPFPERSASHRRHECRGDPKNDDGDTTMKRHAWLLLLSLLLAFPAAAQVVRGYASVGLNLRAGPDIGYPVVDLIPGGASLYVHGCTVDWSWCDVSVYDERGWVAGDFIDYPYDNRWVSVYDYGGFIGIPVVTFVIGDYWHAHYRHRHFYRDRDYWYDHRFAYHRVPRYDHDRRRLAYAFRDDDRDGYRRYRHDEDRRAYHRYDRDRREYRRHDRDHRVADRRQHRDRRIVRNPRGHDRDEHRRRLAPTFARTMLPRERHARAQARHRPAHERRPGIFRPGAGHQSLASAGRIRLHGKPLTHRPARMQVHRGNRQVAQRVSHRSPQRRHADHRNRHHRNHRR
jgi:uncharacterized protein YraI